MSDRVAVYVHGDDPISEAGVAAQLRGRPEAYVVDRGCIDDAIVAVVVTDEIDEAAVRVVRGIQRGGCPRVVLVSTQLDDNGLMIAVEAGVSRQCLSKWVGRYRAEGGVRPSSRRR